MKFWLFIGLCSFFGLPLLAQGQMLGQAPLSQFGSANGEGHDIWGLVGPDGRSYALVTTARGLAVFDLLYPQSPRLVEDFSWNLRGWRDVKTYVYNADPNQFSAYAFVVEDLPGSGDGMRVVDLSNLPFSATETSVYTGVSKAHNIFIHPKATRPYAYLLGSEQAAGGVVVVDISNPNAPFKVGEWSDFYTHDFFTHDVWYDQRYNGKNIGIAFCGRNNVSIIDFTDVSNPTLIEDFTYPNLQYAHSGWVSEDGRWLFICDELDEYNSAEPTKIRVLDLADLQNPILVHTWEFAGRAIDHNPMVRGDYLYFSHYTAGLTVLDITDPLQLTQHWNYDTSPAFPSNFPRFEGAWGVYAYPENDMVLISDIQTGLWVFEMDRIPPICNDADVDQNGSISESEFAFQVPLWPNPLTIHDLVQVLTCP